jgi:predicted exporter
MQSSLLPELVQLTDYIYTLLGLTVATLILVINLPHIMNLWQALRKVQSLFWRWAAQVSKTSARRLFAMNKPPDRVHEQDLEMQNGNMGEVIRQEEV